MATSRILVWDLPTRLFHWSFAVGLVFCFALAEMTDEHSSWFQAHMVIGIVLGLMLALRVLWGFVGTKYSRFSSLLYSPVAVLRYVQGALTGRDQRSVGHNPGSAYGILAMLALTGAVIGTGLMMSSGGEASEEFHEISSYALIGAVLVHIVGVIWYSLRHRENITLSMFTGTKQGEFVDAISSSRPWSALLFVVILGYTTASLFRDLEPSKGQTRLPVFGTPISLGEGEQDED